jgi:AP-1 complex subunit mu
VLQEYIKTEANKMEQKKNSFGGIKKNTGAGDVGTLNVPTAASNAVSWRPEGIKHPKNEVFLDVVEKLNILVSANGSVLRCEIIGAVKMKTSLTGMPELKLGLNDKQFFDMSGKQSRNKLIEMEDIKFH